MHMSLGSSYFFGMFCGFNALLIILILLLSWEGDLNAEDPTSNIFGTTTILHLPFKKEFYLFIKY